MNRPLLLLLALVATPATAFAQDEPEGAEVAGPVKVNLLELLGQGGFMMWFLGVLSVLTVVLILLFFLTIRRGTVVSDRFMRVAEQ